MNERREARINRRQERKTSRVEKRQDRREDRREAKQIRIETRQGGRSTRQLNRQVSRDEKREDKEDRMFLRQTSRRASQAQRQANRNLAKGASTTGTIDTPLRDTESPYNIGTNVPYPTYTALPSRDSASSDSFGGSGFIPQDQPYDEGTGFIPANVEYADEYYDFKESKSKNNTIGFVVVGGAIIAMLALTK